MLPVNDWLSKGICSAIFLFCRFVQGNLLFSVVLIYLCSMKASRIPILFMAFIVVSLYSCDKAPVFPVEYRITFTSEWGVSAFPADYPPSASLSAFVAYSHQSSNSNVFTVNTLALSYLQEFAETATLDDLLTAIDLLRSSNREL